jgi:hypothetical protein
MNDHSIKFTRWLVMARGTKLKKNNWYSLSKTTIRFGNIRLSKRITTLWSEDWIRRIRRIRLLSGGACHEAPSPCCRASRRRRLRIGSCGRHRRRRFSQRSCRGLWWDCSHRGRNADRNADPVSAGPSLAPPNSSLAPRGVRGFSSPTHSRCACVCGRSCRRHRRGRRPPARIRLASACPEGRWLLVRSLYPFLYSLFDSS